MVNKSQPYFDCPGLKLLTMFYATSRTHATATRTPLTSPIRAEKEATGPPQTAGR
jgi:hypothetical protein